MSEFKKETRYVVLKLSKLTDHQKTALGAALAEINLDESAMPECVVVEHDWPNYQETWDAIQAIVEGRYVSNNALKSEAADAFGDGYYDGFIDGAKFQDSEDMNTKTDSGLAGIAEEAMRCSEIAEGEKSNRLGIVSRQALAAQVEALRGADAILTGIANGLTNDPVSVAKGYVAGFGDKHLRELRAEAGRAGYEIGALEWCFNVSELTVYIETAADHYADSIRQEGE